MADINIKKILLVTNDSALEKHIRKLSAVITAKQIQTAAKILEKSQGDYSLVVLGPPFGDRDKQQLEHPNIFVINQPEDVATLFELYRPQQKQGKTQRKIRPLKADLNYASAKGTVLLITTNRATVEEFSCFELIVATNIYSAQRLIRSHEVKLIVTEDFKPKTNLPTYKWGVDILTKKDVYLLLTTGRFSLETASE